MYIKMFLFNYTYKENGKDSVNFGKPLVCNPCLCLKTSESEISTSVVEVALIKMKHNI